MKEKYLYARKYGNEPTDLKLMFIYFVRNFKYVVYAAIAGCILFALGYYLTNYVLVKEHQYVAQGELYIEYAQDVRLDNIYINDYTWQNLVHTDKAIDYVRERMSFSLSEEELKACVTANLVSDVRFVTMKVTRNEPEQAVEIARLFQDAIILFAEEMVDIENIVVFSSADKAEKIEGDNRTLKMALTGMLTGALLAVFGILFCYTLDDSIYVPVTFERRFGVPVIGVFHNRTEKELREIVSAEEPVKTNEERKRDLLGIKIAKLNMKKCCEGCMNLAVTDISVKPGSERAFETLLYLKLLNEQDEMTDIARGDLDERDALFSDPNFRLDCKETFEGNAEAVAECAKYDGTILLVRAGEHNTKVIERALNFMKKQGVNVVGALLYDADAWILNFYYYTPISLFMRKQQSVAAENADLNEETEDSTIF